MTYEGTHVLLCSYGEAVAPGRHWCDPPFASSGPGEAVSHSCSVLTDTDQCFHTREFVKDTDQPAPTLSGEAWHL